MRRKKGGQQVFEQIEIQDVGAEGKAIARINELVVFVPFVVPGDVADIRIIKRHKNYLEGKAIRFHRYSEKRIPAFCEHFGICGGCRWQNLSYSDQLFYKQKQVSDHITRIGKFESPEIMPILPSSKTQFYRNKLEYTFSNHRWLTSEEIKNPGEKTMNAVGFHIPQLFDRVVDIHQCYLQPDPSNEIRLTVKHYASDHSLPFYDARNQTGFLRNLIIRNTNLGEIMVILVVREELPDIIHGILDNLVSKVQPLTSIYYVINPKQNDSLYGLDFHLYKGEQTIREHMASFSPGLQDLEFRIGPNSFFQTNTEQAGLLYFTAASLAGFTGNELVYDLYTGTGSIANYIARNVRHVIGIETVAEAVYDAQTNAKLNGITNVDFITGIAEKMFDQPFIARYGSPDVIITDPPRAGMHPEVIRTIRSAAPQKIVYISCNSATQARDIALLKDQYELITCQPVDMFPHTHHVENIVLLRRKASCTDNPTDNPDHLSNAGLSGNRVPVPASVSQ